MWTRRATLWKTTKGYDMGRRSRRQTEARNSYFGVASLILGTAACLVALVPGTLGFLRMTVRPLALSAFYISLTFTLFSVIAGVVALVDVRRGKGGVKGWRKAAGGMILSALSCAVLAGTTVYFGGLQEAGQMRASERRLAKISRALKSYVATYGSMPPACLVDENGRRMHSWRVLLLPHFDDPELKTLYDRYDFNEPWDGPNNRRLASQAPDVYHSPIDPSPTEFASYLVVESEGFVFDGAKCTKLDDVVDGAEKTIAFVEVVNSGINWLKPQDLQAEELDFRLDAPGVFSKVYANGRNCLLANGQVAFLYSDRKPGEVRAMFTIAGGESLVGPTLRIDPHPPSP